MPLGTSGGFNPGPHHVFDRREAARRYLRVGEGGNIFGEVGGFEAAGHGVGLTNVARFCQKTPRRKASPGEMMWPAGACELPIVCLPSTTTPAFRAIALMPSRTVTRGRDARRECWHWQSARAGRTL